MEHNTRLAQLMRLSWAIQKKKHNSRSKALLAAWAIMQNEDITIYQLVQKDSTRQAKTEKYTQKLALFAVH